MAEASENVSALTRLFAATLGTPVVKVAAFSYGVREVRAGRASAAALGPVRALEPPRPQGLSGVVGGSSGWRSAPASASRRPARQPGRATPHPEGISRSLTAAVDALRDLADDVRVAMAEREQELRVALGVEAGTMDAGSAAEQRAPRAS